jgi:hypothetical protein
VHPARGPALQIPIPYPWIYQLLQWTQQRWAQGQGFAALYGPQVACLVDKAPGGRQYAENAARQARQPVQGGNTAGPNGQDPRNWGSAFRSAAEKYPYQTSGTRFGDEVWLSVNVNGLPKTVEVDGIADGFPLATKRFSRYLARLSDRR